MQTEGKRQMKPDQHRAVYCTSRLMNNSNVSRLGRKYVDSIIYRRLIVLQATTCCNAANLKIIMIDNTLAFQSQTQPL